MTITPLVRQVAAQIIDYVNTLAEPTGTPLSERQLASRLLVSRSPVRKALQFLYQQGLVDSLPQGGFAAKQVAIENIDLTCATEHSAGEQLYQQLAADRLAGTLKGRISENELLRRYQVSRPLLTRVLQRIEFDGWIAPLPGHGWIFPEMETSIKDYLDGYRFRAVIEPAAILDPTFEPDIQALRKCQQEHQQLLANGLESATSQEIFEINKRLHETIISGSHNSFFISSLKRVNGLRRLLEYRQKSNHQAALRATKEHLEIIRLLLADEREQAAAVLSKHLKDISERRSQDHASINTL